MRNFMVKMTIEVREEAQDEDEALLQAKLNFNYSDLHYADVVVEELQDV